MLFLFWLLADQILEGVLALDDLELGLANLELLGPVGRRDRELRRIELSVGVLGLLERGERFKARCGVVAPAFW